MPTYQSKITIPASPSIVFSYLVEPDLCLQWIGGLKSSTPITHDGLRVGARSREIIENRGKESEIESEVVDLHIPTHVQFRLRSDMLSAHSTYRLQSQNNATEVTSILDATYRPFFLKIFAPFLRSTVQKKLDNDLQQLKSLIRKKEPKG